MAKKTLYKRLYDLHNEVRKLHDEVRKDLITPRNAHIVISCRTFGAILEYSMREIQFESSPKKRKK